MYTYMNMYIFVYICISIYIYIYKHIYIYIHIHVYISKYTYVYVAGPELLANEIHNILALLYSEDFPPPNHPHSAEISGQLSHQNFRFSARY